MTGKKGSIDKGRSQELKSPGSSLPANKPVSRTGVWKSYPLRRKSLPETTIDEKSKLCTPPQGKKRRLSKAGNEKDEDAKIDKGEEVTEKAPDEEAFRSPSSTGQGSKKKRGPAKKGASDVKDVRNEGTSSSVEKEDEIEIIHKDTAKTHGSEIHDGSDIVTPKGRAKKGRAKMTVKKAEDSQSDNNECDFITPKGKARKEMAKNNEKKLQESESDLDDSVITPKGSARKGKAKKNVEKTGDEDDSDIMTPKRKSAGKRGVIANEENAEESESGDCDILTPKGSARKGRGIKKNEKTEGDDSDSMTPKGVTRKKQAENTEEKTDEGADMTPKGGTRKGRAKKNEEKTEGDGNDDSDIMTPKGGTRKGKAKKNEEKTEEGSNDDIMTPKGGTRKGRAKKNEEKTEEDGNDDSDIMTPKGGTRKGKAKKNEEKTEEGSNDDIMTPKGGTRKGRAKKNEKKTEGGSDDSDIMTPKGGTRKGRAKKNEEKTEEGGSDDGDIMTPKGGTRKGRAKKNEEKTEEGGDIMTPKGGTRKGRPKKNEEKTGESPPTACEIATAKGRAKINEKKEESESGLDDESPKGRSGKGMIQKDDEKTEESEMDITDDTGILSPKEKGKKGMRKTKAEKTQVGESDLAIDDTATPKEKGRKGRAAKKNEKVDAVPSPLETAKKGSRRQNKKATPKAVSASESISTPVVGNDTPPKDGKGITTTSANKIENSDKGSRHGKLDGSNDGCDIMIPQGSFSEGKANTNQEKTKLTDMDNGGKKDGQFDDAVGGDEVKQSTAVVSQPQQEGDLNQSSSQEGTLINKEAPESKPDSPNVTRGSEQEELLNTSLDDTTGATSSTPKTVGRGRGLFRGTPISESESNNSFLSPVPKRGRGRPRGRPRGRGWGWGSPAQFESDTSFASPSQNESESTTPLEGRRNRRVRVATPTVETLSDDTDSTPFARRGPGRPRGRGRGRGRGLGRGKRSQSDDSDSDLEGPSRKKAKKEDGRGRKHLPPEKVEALMAKYPEQTKLWQRDLEENEIVRCPRCGVFRKTVDTILVHFDKCPADEVCGVCQKIFPTLARIKYHMMAEHQRVHHPKHPEGLTGPEADFEIFRKMGKIFCLPCNKMFKNLQYYRFHVEWCGKEHLTFVCEICEHTIKLMYQRDHLAKHRRDTARAERQAELEAELEEREAEEKRILEAEGGPGLTATGSIRRKAAKRAIETMQDLGKDITEAINEVEGKKSRASDLREYYDSPALRSIPPEVLASWYEAIAEKTPINCPYEGCDYMINNLPMGRYHYRSCKTLGEDRMFRCKKCDQSYGNEASMKYHVEKSHIAGSADGTPSEDSDSEDSVSGDDSDEDEVANGEGEISGDPSEAKKKRKKTRGSRRDGRRRAKGAHNTAAFKLGVFPPAAGWSLEYWQKHEGQDLYPEWKPSKDTWVPITEGLEDYFPVTTESCSFQLQQHGKKLTESGTLPRFGATPIQDLTALNVGGPVWGAAWCPTPLGAECDQYLAVSTHRGIEETHQVSDLRAHKGLIQLWHCGTLGRGEKSKGGSAPDWTVSLALGILHEFGCIWELKWCPSGAWEDPGLDCHNGGLLPRLGLLMAACSDGRARILSVPQPVALRKTLAGTEAPCYKPSSWITLQPGSPLMKDPPLSNCLCVDWTPYSGHKLVAAGFGNGKVMLWDLQTKASTLKRQQQHDGNHGNDLHLYPYKTLSGHFSPVMGVSFSPQSEHHLVSVGQDRYVKFWDVDDASIPLAGLRYKTVLTGVVSMIGYPGVFLSADDSYCFEHNCIAVMTVTSNGLASYPAIPHNSIIWDLDYSDWLHTTVGCDGAGQVVMCILGNLNRQILHEKRMPYRRQRILDITMEPKSTEKSLALPPGGEVENQQEEATSSKLPRDSSPGNAQGGVSEKDTKGNDKNRKKSLVKDSDDQTMEADSREISSNVTICPPNDHGGSEIITAPSGGEEDNQKTGMPPGGENGNNTTLSLSADQQDCDTAPTEVKVGQGSSGSEVKVGQGSSGSEVKLEADKSVDTNADTITETSDLNKNTDSVTQADSSSNALFTVPESVGGTSQSEKVGEATNQKPQRTPKKKQDCSENEPPKPAPRTFKEITEGFTLVINKIDQKDLVPPSKLSFPNELPSGGIEGLPISSMTRVCWNPNFGYHTWLFTGGQAGLGLLQEIKGLKSSEHEKLLKNTFQS